MNSDMSIQKKENTIWEEKNYIAVQKTSVSKPDVEETSFMQNTGKEYANKECKNTGWIRGIYKIINKKNGKYYIGSSNNICNKRKCRWDTHHYQLKKGIHHNVHLQRAWNKYGQDNFDFVIVEEVSDGDLIPIEQRYLDVAFTEQHRCYNLSFVAEHAGKFPSHVIEKMRARNQGKGNPMYGKRGVLSPLFGKHPSPETRAKLQRLHLGKKRSLETKQKLSQSKMGSRNPFYKTGPRRAIEASALKRRRYIIQLDNFGNIIKEFPSISSAASDLHLDTGAISRVCSGFAKQTKGLYFRYK